MTATDAPQPLSYDDAWRLASTAEWKLESYYKYAFYFKAEAEGRTLTASVGGSAEDIYKFTVTPAGMTWEDLAGGGEIHLTVADADGAVLWDGWPL